ncbi:MAG: hypothetical protein U5K29_09835 [Acidimicrobiales bacterium]|nr:hypothetical protein [Acidimicrobiales bacterium]
MGHRRSGRFLLVVSAVLLFAGACGNDDGSDFTAAETTVLDTEGTPDPDDGAEDPPGSMRSPSR